MMIYDNPQLNAPPIVDYSVMAEGFDGHSPIECYFYVLADNAKFESGKLTCLLDSIGCVTFLQFNSTGWFHRLPPAPFQQNICLSRVTSQSISIGECKCNQTAFCQCYCIGSLCNTRYDINVLSQFLVRVKHL